MLKYIRSLLVGLLLSGASLQANESPDALQDAFMAALKANDADGIAACYAGDAVNFAVDSLVGIGPEAVRESWGGFFSTLRVTDAALSRQHMETHGDTAIAWGLFKMTGAPVGGGERVEMIGRYMDVARNFDGKWLYVADHASMPLPGPESDSQ